jgi:hypothetical protein
MARGAAYRVLESMHCQSCAPRRPPPRAHGRETSQKVRSCSPTGNQCRLWVSSCRRLSSRRRAGGAPHDAARGRRGRAALRLRRAGGGAAHAARRGAHGGRAHHPGRGHQRRVRRPRAAHRRRPLRRLRRRRAAGAGSRSPTGADGSRLRHLGVPAVAASRGCLRAESSTNCRDLRLGSWLPRAHARAPTPPPPPLPGARARARARRLPVGPCLPSGDWEYAT